VSGAEADAAPARRLYASVIACTIVGQLGLVFAPFLLPLAMQQAHVGDLAASRILSAEFAAYLVTALAASSVRAFNSSRVAVMACAAYAGGSFASAISTEAGGFCVARLVCGMAGGAVMVAANRAIASHPAYERLLAAAIMGTLVFATLGLSIVGALLENFGPSSTYATLGVVGAVAACLSPFMLIGGREVRLAGLDFGWVAYALLAAFFFSRLSDAVLWPYTERFGERVGLGSGQVGVILALSVLVAVAAPVIALRVRSERGITALFSTAIAAKAGMPLAMTLFATASVFAAAQFVVSFSLILVGQLFMTRFSAIDPTGRLAGFGGTAGLAADAVGVAVAGQSFALDSFRGIAVGSGLLGVAGLLICLVALSARRRRHGEGA